MASRALHHAFLVRDLDNVRELQVFRRAGEGFAR
jgi:hypothetical protein